MTTQTFDTSITPLDLTPEELEELTPILEAGLNKIMFDFMVHTIARRQMSEQAKLPSTQHPTPPDLIH
jgi:hypothetical protein